MLFAKNITSLFLTIIYILPMFINIGEISLHLSECKEESSCCSTITENNKEIEIIEEMSCCKPEPTQQEAHIENKCDDSIFCQYCLQNCSIQNNLTFDYNIGFQTILNITYKIEPKVKIIKNIIIKTEDIHSSYITVNHNDEITHKKIITEFLSSQYHSSDII